MSKNLIGKVALVTGGSRGVGAATARRLAEAGADVAVSYASSAAKANAVVDDLKAVGVRAAAFRADQASVDEAVTLVDDVAAHFGRLDIMVNNAAAYERGTLDDPDRDEAVFARQLVVNLTSVVAATRRAARHMGEGSRVILISSDIVDLASFPGGGDYAATKAALETYGRSWARDLGPRGITVNSVVLGLIDTDMVSVPEGDAMDAILGRMAIQRMGTPTEVANVIAFLAGPESSYVTGARFRVDGGLNV